MIARVPLVVDACVLLNLLATERLEEIAEANNVTLWVPAIILKREVKYLHAFENGQRGERVEINLANEIERGVIIPIDRPSDEEVLTSFEIRHGAGIGPGEAIAIATAVHRGGVVGTDDRRAISVMSERAPNIERWGTGKIIQTWCEQSEMQPPEVCRVLQAINVRSRFKPASDDQDALWWKENSV